LVGAQNATTGLNTNSGLAYLYQPNGTLLHIFTNPTPETDAFFGQAVASNGNVILIGAPGAAGQSGRAYLFEASTYQLISNFTKDSPSANDEFGAAVAVFGENFLAGAPHDNQGASSAGAVYRFGVKTEWDPGQSRLVGLGLRFSRSRGPCGHDPLAISGNRAGCLRYRARYGI
jgi:FG-GAP repeat